MADKPDNLHPDTTRFGKIHKERQAKRKVKAIPMPEWDTEDEQCILYAYPLTVSQAEKIDTYGSVAEQNVMQIITQCMDEKGDPYFTLLDKTALMNEPGDVIGHLLIQLNQPTSSFDKELKKNNE